MSSEDNRSDLHLIDEEESEPDYGDMDEEVCVGYYAYNVSQHNRI